MAITNVKGGSPSSVKFGDFVVSMSVIGEVQSAKAEWTPVELEYDDKKTTYVVGDGVLEIVVLPSDATTIARIQGFRTGSNFVQITGSDDRRFRTPTAMTFTSKPTRFEGGQDVILIKGTLQTPSEDLFFVEGT